MEKKERRGNRRKKATVDHKILSKDPVKNLVSELFDRIKQRNPEL